MKTWTCGILIATIVFLILGCGGKSDDKTGAPAKQEAFVIDTSYAVFRNVVWQDPASTHEIYTSDRAELLVRIHRTDYVSPCYGSFAGRNTPASRIILRDGREYAVVDFGWEGSTNGGMVGKDLIAVIDLSTKKYDLAFVHVDDTTPIMSIKYDIPKTYDSDMSKAVRAAMEMWFPSPTLKDANPRQQFVLNNPGTKESSQLKLVRIQGHPNNGQVNSLDSTRIGKWMVYSEFKGALYIREMEANYYFVIYVPSHSYDWASYLLPDIDNELVFFSGNAESEDKTSTPPHFVFSLRQGYRWVFPSPIAPRAALAKAAQDQSHFKMKLEDCFVKE